MTPARDSTAHRPLRIACGQGFWGDRLDAPVEQVRRGPIDFLMLDYLAEVTMSILQKQKARDPAQGYARDFVPLLEEIFPDIVEKGIRVISNAGGVNIAGCRDALLEAARKAGVAGRARVGTVTGDDILERLPELIAGGHELANMDDGRPLAEVLDRVESANAYIGAYVSAVSVERPVTITVASRASASTIGTAPM